jgi:hypothetical protein
MLKVIYSWTQNYFQWQLFNLPRILKWAHSGTDFIALVFNKQKVTVLRKITFQITASATVRNFLWRLKHNLLVSWIIKDFFYVSFFCVISKKLFRAIIFTGTVLRRQRQLLLNPNPPTLTGKIKATNVSS